MAQKILDRSASVVVVDASGAARQLLSDTVKAMGFEDVRGIATIKDVLEFLETDHADWILCPSDADSEYNLLSLLKVITTNPSLKDVGVSGLLEEEEGYITKPALELGMLSWHAKPFTKDSLEEELNELTERADAGEGAASLVAAEYVREFLKQDEAFDTMLALEKSLLSLFPGNARLLLHLAEAQLLGDNKTAGKATLKQASLLDPALEEEASALASTYLNEGGDSAEGEEGGEGDGEGEEGAEAEEVFNVLGISKILVVDPDDSIQNALKDIFEEMGVPEVKFAQNGDDAVEWISSNQDADLIVQEWRIPKVPGHIFLQRLVAAGAATVPIIVLSSLVKPEDMPLVKEMGVANIVSKPFDKADFMKSLIWTIQQDRMPTEAGTVELKIRNCIKAREDKELGELISRYLADETAPAARKKVIEAEYAYYKREYEAARDACVEAIKISGDSITALNLLGKCFMQLRDFDSALKCLQKAQSLSPQNIERLCNIAEVHQELGDDEAANEALEEASDIDPDSQTVEESKVKIAMTKGDTDSAKAMMENMSSLEPIIAYMNNKAVALARCELVEDSVSQYKKTLKALPEGETEFRSLVHYNLALAHARDSELEEAKIHVDKALNDPNEKIKSKAQSLRKRIEHSLNSGADFKLKAAKPDESQANKQGEGDADSQGEESSTLSIENLAIVSEVLARKGEIGCYMIYSLDEQKSNEANKMLAKIPRFKKRSGIEREETLKGESMLKGA